MISYFKLLGVLVLFGFIGAVIILTISYFFSLIKKYFKNTKNLISYNKTKEVIVTQNSVRVVMTPEELLRQEYEDGVEDILKQTIIKGKYET